MMRKVKSAPSLLGLESSAAASMTPPAAPGTGMRRAANSYSALAAFPNAAAGRGERTLSKSRVDAPAHGFAGSTVLPASKRTRSAAAPAALGPVWQLPTLADLAAQETAIEVVAEEAEEFLVETASRGLTAASCFEQFGWPQDAPPLADEHMSAEAVASRSAERSAAQMQLAACLATPIIDDKGLGESVDATVRRLAVAQQEQVQLRYVAELKRSATEPEERSLVTSSSTAEERQREAVAAAQAQRRLKRRSSSDMDRYNLAELMGGSGLLASPSLSTSPETAALLAQTFAAFEDGKNTLSVDEDLMGSRLDLPPDVLTVDDNDDLLCLEALLSMDAPDPEAPPSSNWPRTSLSGIAA